MAFNAGSIEATLTLNRNPFTAGLAAARNQARSFAKEKYEATAKINVDDVSFTAAKKKFEEFANKKYTASAKVNVERLAFDKLLADLKIFSTKKYTATVDVDTRGSASSLRALMSSMDDSGRSARTLGNNLEDAGNRGGKAFKGMDSTVRSVLIALPLLLPVAATAITGVIGLVGALTSILVTAGVGVGAFALVAVPAFKKVSEAVAAGQDEINKLPPGLKQAATALQGLTKAYEDLQAKTQNGVGQAMAAGFNAATAAVKTLAPVINAMSTVLVKIGKEMQTYFGTAQWKTFVDFISKNVGPVFSSLWDIIKFGTQAVMNLTQAFMPLGQWLLDAIASGMAEFAKWTATLAGSSEFHQWLEDVKVSLKNIWDFLVEVTKFLFNLATALTPLGNIILPLLTGIFEALNKMPPEWLAGIAMGIAGIFTALMLGAGGPVALAVGVVLGLAAALSSLYDNNEKVRASIDGFVSYLQTKFQPIWDTIVSNFNTKIVPAWQSLVDTYNQYLRPVFEDLAAKAEVLWPPLLKIADTITGSLIPGFLEFVKAIAPFVAILTQDIGTVGIDALRLLLEAFNITMDGIATGFKVFASIFKGDWETAWTELKDFALRTFDQIKIEFAPLWSDITTTLQEEGAQWAEAWNGVIEAVKGIWSGFTSFMTNGFGTMITWIEDKIGVSHGTIAGMWQGLWDSLKGTFDTVVEAIKTAWNFLFGDVQTNLETRGQEIKDAWEKLWGPIRDFIVPIIDEIKLAWANLWGGDDGIVPVQTAKQEEVNTSFLGWLAGMVSGVLTFITTVQTNWNNFWNGLWESYNTWNTNTTQGWNDFWNGLLVAAATAIANFIVSWNEFWAGLGATFSTWWAGVVAEWTTFWSNLAAGVTQGAADILAPWVGMLADFVAEAKRIWAEVQTAFTDGVSGVRSAVNGMLGGVNGVLGFFGIAGVPLMAEGGQVPQYAAGGNIGGGFKTNGPQAIVGEGHSAYPEYVIPTDPKYSGRAQGLYHALGNDLNMMADGGVLGTGIPSLNFPSLPSLDSVMGAMAGQASGPFLGIAQGVAQKIWGALTAKVNEAIAAAQSAISAALNAIGGAVSGATSNLLSGAASQFGWGSGAELAALNWIVGKESGGNPNAQNPTSSAYGMFQFLDGTWASTGIGKTSDPSLQALAGMRYISSRYGSPTNAQAFWQANGWYDDGGFLPPGQTMALNGTGQPEAVLTAPQWDAVKSNADNGDILRKLDELIEVVQRSKPIINVNNSGGAQTQNARNDQLALRLGRR